MKDTHAVKIPKSDYTYNNFQIDGRGYAEGLKLSNLDNVFIADGHIIGGYEDCIDCVRGSNYLFENLTLEAGDARTFVTAKGGLSYISFKNITLKGKTKWPWDFSFGDHTIYYNQGDKSWTKNIVLDDVRREDSKKVTILCLLSDRPRVKNGDYRVIMVPKWIVKSLFFVNKIISKIKNGKYTINFRF